VLNMTIPKLRTLSKYKLDKIPGYSNVTSKVRGLVSDMVIGIKPGNRNQPWIDLSHCKVSI